MLATYLRLERSPSVAERVIDDALTLAAICRLASSILWSLVPVPFDAVPGWHLDVTES